MDDLLVLLKDSELSLDGLCFMYVTHRMVPEVNAMWRCFEEFEFRLVVSASLPHCLLSVSE